MKTMAELEHCQFYGSTAIYAEVSYLTKEASNILFGIEQPDIMEGAE